MTIFSTNSIFQPVQKYLKYNNTDIAVINGANKVNALPLCGVKIDYQQYQRISVQIPKGQTDFVLSFPMLGIKTTFITIKPTYCGVNPKLNYLKWKFQPSSDAKWSFTNILTLTGCPTLSTDDGLGIRPQEISEICKRPSTPPKSIKAP